MENRTLSIAIVGTFPIFTRDAGANRVFTFAEAAAKRGHKIKLLSLAPTRSKSTEVQHHSSSIDCHSIGELCPLQTGSRVLSSIGRSFLAVAAVEKFYKQSASSLPDLIIAYSPGGIFGLSLITWARRRGITVLFDIVEWYDHRQCLFGFFGPFYYDSEFLIRIVARRADGVIAISSYLEKFFRSQGVSTFRLPGLVNDDSFVGTSFIEQKSLTTFRVLYSGFPGLKDLIAPLFRAIQILVGEGYDVELRMCGRDIRKALLAQGITEQELISAQRYHIFDWVTPDELSALRATSDVAVVIRSPMRASVANFPQKLGEYMALGIPVIVSGVGDGALVIRHEVDGHILSQSTATDIANAIRSLIKDPIKHKALGANAKTRAKDCLHIDGYIAPLEQFFSDCISRATGRAG